MADQTEVFRIEGIVDHPRRNGAVHNHVDVLRCKRAFELEEP